MVRQTRNKRNRSQRSQRSQTRKRQTNVLHLNSGSAKEVRAMNAMIQNGPYTMILVFSRKCPHCITYMPLWKQLCKIQGRRANMISMESDVYSKTPFVSKKPVSAVPTVLYVNDRGEIQEVTEPRDMSAMTNTVMTGSLSPSSDVSDFSGVSDSFQPSSSSSNVSESNSNYNTSYENTASNVVVKHNPLHPLPASTISSEGQKNQTNQKTQRGGNPWAAFMLSATQAAPAAALLGAYSMLPTKRSSGLGDAKGRRH